MTRPARELVSVDGVRMEVEVRGSGEPILLVQTALTADELHPLAQQPALRDSYRTVLYHRRGYAGSSPVDGPGSVARDAADCQALLAALGICASPHRGTVLQRIGRAATRRRYAGLRTQPHAAGATAGARPECG